MALGRLGFCRAGQRLCLVNAHFFSESSSVGVVVMSITNFLNTVLSVKAVCLISIGGKKKQTQLILE